MAIHVSFLGLGIDAMTGAEAVSAIRGCWASGTKTRVFFVNAHCLNVAASTQEYREALGKAEYVLTDGSGMLFASRVLRLPIRHNLNGTDLTPRLCAEAEREGRSVYLLGAAPGVADRAAEKLRARFPALRIVGVQHGYFDAADEPAIIERINAARPDLLLVAFGVPLQELWVTRHLAQLDAGVIVAVGALFDFLSESVPRAPEFFRRRGVEWLYRLSREPRRLWRRYLIGNFTFTARILAARFLGVQPLPPLRAPHEYDETLLAFESLASPAQPPHSQGAMQTTLPVETETLEPVESPAARVEVGVAPRGVA